MTDNISEIAEESVLDSGEQVLDNSPGSQLRRAREMAGLSREELSRRLCMTGNKLELLERDDYHRLPGPIYVRGYIRNICKALGADAEPVLQAYAGYCTAEEASREIVAHVSRGMVIRERKRSLRGLALIPLIVGGAVFWWMHGSDVTPTAIIAAKPAFEDMQVASLADQTSSPGAEALQSIPGAPTPEHAGEDAYFGDDEVRGGYSVADGGVAGGESADGLAESAVTEIAESEPLAAEPVADQVAAAEAESVAVPTPAEPAAEVAEAPEPGAEAAAAASSAELQLSFEEEAWVEVKDAAGALLLANLQPAGSEALLTGQPPFQLMLGNAESTQVRYRGELIDSDPIGNRRTRRLTVGD
ncbi:RodZ domain-containing protein [Microbulbifer magnicolonia]|uniref:RodZ domain-containing protein n=1 Tax=Microbulbifer magnicolonia TaxID=3109744 RepID=UPI002B40A892|nr:RodZ domain-containing protein [Microbulbifer sp. GG15]